MPQHLLLFARFNTDWFIVMAALVILVVMIGYVRAKLRKKEKKEADWQTTDKPFRDFAGKFMIGIFVALCFWAFEAFKGH